MQQVEFSIWPAQKRSVGVIRLQNQKTLNSLSLEMVRAIATRLGEWERNAAIAAVIVYSDLAKSFCAGGDVKTVVLELLRGDPNGYSAEFFETEYKMDYMIATYSKPILVWGNGIVMGGGMGIFCGASHGVVTETTVMSMPEIAIGFFPDVGAGLFLNRVGRELGTFLAWTAARLSGDDAVDLGFACAKVLMKKRTEVFKLMRDISWSGDGAADKRSLSSALAAVSEPKGSGGVGKHLAEIKRVFSGDDPIGIAREFSSLNVSDAWMQEAQKSFLNGSPLSALVSFSQLQRARDMSTLDAFLMEWSIARHMADRGDFREGVRARLIDKDNKPVWQKARIEDVSATEVESYFAPYAGLERVREQFLKR